MTVNRNRLGNAKNPYQGDFKKVLCVCSAGLLRSPTLAWVLSQDPFNFNTRAVGHTQDFALIPIDAAHVYWADEIVCVEPSVADAVRAQFDEQTLRGKEFTTLTVPDRFEFRDPNLVKIIREQYVAALVPSWAAEAEAEIVLTA